MLEQDLAKAISEKTEKEKSYPLRLEKLEFGFLLFARPGPHFDRNALLRRFSSVFYSASHTALRDAAARAAVEVSGPSWGGGGGVTWGGEASPGGDWLLKDVIPVLA